MVFLIFILGFSAGILFAFLLAKFSLKYSQKKLEDEYNNFFKEISSLIGTKSFKFVSRFNDYVTFKAETDSLGQVSVIITLDNKNISILQNDKLVYTDHHADRKLVDGILDNILKSYSSKINDCFKVMDNIVDKNTIRKMNPDIDLPDAFPKPPTKTFSIDIILDRINEVGISNLTDEEKKFLEDYQKSLR